MMKRYLLYLVRWQLSTPILAVVLIVFAKMNTVLSTIIANLIGGLIFFWVDRFIFKRIAKNPLWEITEDVSCADCGKRGRGYRIVEWGGYNRAEDKKPKFRCEVCKDAKYEEVKHKAGAFRRSKK